ncbi:MAG: DUF2800 domain-containing protein [Bacilli bacterium]
MKNQYEIRGDVHALLSASSSKQWLACTPSARLSEQFEDQGSTYAAEGSLAHEIAELKLRKAYLEPMSTRTYNSLLKKLQAQLAAQPDWDQSMERHLEMYTDYIAQLVHAPKTKPYIAIEKRLDYSAYAQDGFGTSDCIIITGSTLYINDLKYGKGVPVGAERNTQMMLYALGAVAEYSFLYPIYTVKMAIVQPRLDAIWEDEISLTDLLDWGASIKPIAALAYAGEGEFVPGDHCRFCRARRTCRARADAHTALEDFKMMKPPLISNKEVGEILVRAQQLSKWVSDLEEYALSSCLSGVGIPGWKAVEGLGSRQFVNVDTAFAYLKASGIDEAVLYERKPLTAPAVERVLGKADFRTLLVDTGHVNQVPGKPTLAPGSDKREAITRLTAADDFAPVEE